MDKPPEMSWWSWLGLNSMFSDPPSSNTTPSNQNRSHNNLKTKLEIGDRVVWYREFPPTNEAGIVRWLGDIDGEEIAGIEFDRELNIGSGWHRNQLLFHCKPHYGGLISVAGLILEKDCRETFQQTIQDFPNTIHNFGRISTGNNPTAMPPIPHIERPINEDDIYRIEGRNKGVQGHRNSCYLDATLFAMFSFSSVFDSILATPINGNNLSEEDKYVAYTVQKILRDDIVNPLRRNFFTPSQNVMKLRETMHHLDDKICSEEMDPEEFLAILFRRVLHLEDFLSLTSGQSDYFHQVIIKTEGDDRSNVNLEFPTVQRLLEESLFCQNNVKLTKTPSPVLMLLMPRSGNRYKMFKGILPNLTIDITDLMEDQIMTNGQYAYMSQKCHQRNTMDLLAVICIETSHFVSFVRCGTDRAAPWVFFDSMADRSEEGVGHNIPKVTHLPQMGNWLSQLEGESLGKDTLQYLNPELKRLISDPYICVYYSPQLSMYV